MDLAKQLGMDLLEETKTERRNWSAPGSRSVMPSRRPKA
jgi:hypothetical protein